MPSPPRAWPTGVRTALAAGLVVAAFAALVWAKRAFLGAFLAARPWSDAAWLGLLALAAWGAGRGLRAGRLAVWTPGAPLLGVLFVLLMNTPLPYELAHYARDLPHPERTVLSEVVASAPAFERQHPVVTVVFRYGPDRDLRTLTQEAADAFEAAGWRVTTRALPEGNASTDFGYVAAARGPFEAACTLGERSDFADAGGPLRAMGCRVTV